MATPEVREIKHKLSLWAGFRDEMVATAMTLSLLVVGSFVLTQRLLNPPSPSSQSQENSIPTASPQTLGAQDMAPPPTLAPVQEIIQAPPASASADMTEVPYGQDGDYDFSVYTISFRNPRLVFDKKTNDKRKLWVNVWIKNKSAEAGLPMRVTAAIIKDGVVIVPEAALYAPNSRTLMPGDEVSFSASLPLIDSTDVRELKYKPGEGIPEASHFLYP